MERHHGDIVDETVGAGEILYVLKDFFTENRAGIFMMFLEALDEPVDAE